MAQSTTGQSPIALKTLASLRHNIESVLTSSADSSQAQPVAPGHADSGFVKSRESRQPSRYLATQYQAQNPSHAIFSPRAARAQPSPHDLMPAQYLTPP